MTDRPAEDVENTMARSTSAAKDTAPGDEQPVQLTLQAAEIIRDLIRRGELLPGEKIHQVDVARNAGVSRSPLREALRTLAAEGLVKYETNRGYVVSRLRMEELAEIYDLRRLVEAEMLRHIRKPGEDVLERMAGRLAEMEAAIEIGDFNALTVAYRLFHEEMFRLSGLNIFLHEVQRLWKMTDSYNAAHALPPATAQRILRDHRQILRALRAGNLDRVRAIVDALPQINEQVIVGFPTAR
jgi:DNA-binding GntR family transcriptional regulator